jgi:hypothetical protein
MSEVWKRCSTCKKEIAFKSTYYLCSVSTCTRKRTGFTFCSVECWEEHLPLMRHREAWAVEEQAPSKAEWEKERAEEGRGEKPIEKAPPPKPAQAQPSVAVRRHVLSTKEPPLPASAKEVLVIASRLKNYVKEVHGMNTSDGVMEPLSAELRRIVNRAARNAAEDGRKTVLERDFEFLLRG